MLRIQIYIEEQTNRNLNALAKHIGCSKSQLIREALEEYLRKHKQQQLDASFGMWQDHDFDLRALRQADNRHMNDHIIKGRN